MNKVSVLLAAALAFLSTEAFGQIQWEQTGGPNGCVVLDYARDSSGGMWAVVGGANGQLYHSIDDGQSWILKPCDFTTDHIIGMEVGPDGILYCFDDYVSLYQSTDGGNTWTKKYFQLQSGTSGSTRNRIVFLGNGHMLFAGRNGLVESTDNGATWTVKTTFGGGQGFVSDLTLFRKAPNGDLWVGVQPNQNDPYELWVSTDSGQSFDTVYTSNSGSYPFYEMVFMPGAVLFSGGDGIFRTVDNGQIWSQPFSMNPVNGLLAAPDGELYGCVNTQDPLQKHYLIKSNNGGIDWTPITDVPDSTGFGGRMAMTTNGAILLNSRNIWRSTDGGQTWGSTSPNISNLYIQYLKVNPATGTLYAYDSSNGLFKSSDHGETWKYILSSIYGGYTNQTSFCFTSSGHVFLIKDGKLLRSVDDGETWQDRTPADFINLQIFPINVEVSPTGKVFLDANSQDDFYFSPDEGETWQPIPINVFGGINYRLAVTDTLQFAGDFAHYNYYRTLDGGISWTELTPPDQFFGSWYQLHWTAWGELFACYDYQLYRSTDLGNTWAKVKVGEGFIDLGWADIYSTSDGRMFIWAYNEGIFFTDDFGLTWAKLMEDQYLNGDIYIPGNCSAFDEGQYLYIGTGDFSVWRSSQVNLHIAKITGQIQKDQNDNCQTDPADLPLQKWLIQATDTAGHTNYATSDPTGNYRLGFIIPDSTTSNLSIEVQPPNQLWQPCNPAQLVTVSPQDDTATGIDFPMDAVVDCPLLDVSASFWPARPCFPLTVGADWCNLGTLPALGSRLFLKLDELISVDSASMPIAAQHGDTLEFLIGNVALNQCGSVRVYGHLSCDAAIGQAICVSAKVTPDTICAAFPAWSGATLHATANCSGDTVVDFTIKNIGTAPSTSGLEYVVIEDQVLLFTGQVPSLVPGADITFGQPADGSTFSLKGEQEPGHPVSNFIFAWAEGCGEPPSGQPEFGWITPFLGEDGDPFSDEFCREATASYDPNLKEALPVGYGVEHFISPNQAIDFFLHFQNTGTDTAFQVVLRDTISPLLDLASLRMGASSHPFSYEIYGDGILKFIFKKINLPDSTVNEPASHGWVNFQIGQKKDLPLGTVIRNHVGIYFDFNPPVLTNETWHTLGENFLMVDVKNLTAGAAIKLQVFPNPMGDAVNFRLEGVDNQPFMLQIFGQDGRLARSDVFFKKEFLLKREGLPCGVYFFKIAGRDGVEIGSGKLIAR